MATQKTGFPVTPGAGATLAAETDFSGAKVPVHFAHQARTVPVYGGNASFHVGTLGIASSKDLLAMVPGGTSTPSANFLRVYVPAGGQAAFWSNGLDPVVQTGAPQISGDSYYDFPNVLELTHLYAVGVSTACPVALQWEKTG
jgi:hypothetical protein